MEPTNRVRRRRVEATGENRVALLAAARAVFAERGYLAATLEQIADRAGFSKGAVYSQFGSKADLFLAVLEQRIDERARENLEAVTSRPAGALGDAIREMNARMSRSDPPWRLAVLEFRLVAARDDELRARYAAAHAVTVEGLAALLEQLARRVGTELPVPSRALAAVLLAIDVGVVLEDLADPSAIGDDDLSALLLRMTFGRPPADPLHPGADR